jgi:hypothetical protein
MIESELLNYGILGIWTIYNIFTIQYYRKKEDEFQENFKQLIQNNTIALTKNYETIKFCQKKNGY